MKFWISFILCAVLLRGPASAAVQFPFSFWKPTAGGGGGGPPSDMTNVVAWLEADGLGLSNDDPISTWTDLSGNSNHGTSSGGARPTFKTSQINSLPAVYFNASSNQFFNIGFSALAPTHTAILVVKVDDYANLYGALTGSSSTESLHVGFGSGPTYKLNVWFDDFQPSFTHFNTGQYNVVTYVWEDGVGKRIYANGQSEGTTSSVTHLTGILDGGRIGVVTGGLAFGGYVAAGIWFSEATGTTRREAWENYFGTKFGITITH